VIERKDYRNLGTFSTKSVGEQVQKNFDKCAQECSVSMCMLVMLDAEEKQCMIHRHMAL